MDIVNKRPIWPGSLILVLRFLMMRFNYSGSLIFRICQWIMEFHLSNLVLVFLGTEII